MAMAQTPHVELVAMAPSGETFIARDPEGVLLLFAPTGPAVAIDDATVDRAVAAGFDRVEASFGSWRELDRERQRRAGLLRRDVQVDVTSWDVERVRRTLARMEGWVDEGRTTGARRVLHELLRAAPARRAGPLPRGRGGPGRAPPAACGLVRGD